MKVSMAVTEHSASDSDSNISGLTVRMRAIRHHSRTGVPTVDPAPALGG